MEFCAAEETCTGSRVQRLGLLGSKCIETDTWQTVVVVNCGLGSFSWSSHTTQRWLGQRQQRCKKQGSASKRMEKFAKLCCHQSHRFHHYHHPWCDFKLAKGATVHTWRSKHEKRMCSSVSRAPYPPFCRDRFSILSGSRLIQLCPRLSSQTFITLNSCQNNLATQRLQIMVHKRGSICATIGLRVTQP